VYQTLPFCGIKVNFTYSVIKDLFKNVLQDKVSVTLQRMAANTCYIYDAGFNGCLLNHFIRFILCVSDPYKCWQNIKNLKLPLNI